MCVPLENDISPTGELRCRQPVAAALEPGPLDAPIEQVVIVAALDVGRFWLAPPQTMTDGSLEFERSLDKVPAGGVFRRR